MVSLLSRQRQNLRGRIRHGLWRLRGKNAMMKWRREPFAQCPTVVRWRLPSEQRTAWDVTILNRASSHARAAEPTCRT